jgi:hypothetical protein
MKDKIVRAKSLKSLGSLLDEASEAAIVAAVGEGAEAAANRPRGPEVLAENLAEDARVTRAIKERKRTPPAKRVARAEKITMVLDAVEKRKRVLKQAYDDAGGFEGLAARAMVMNEGVSGGVADTREHTGAKTSYYEVTILHPTKEGRGPYTAECNDIIEALGMSFAEGEAFKALWRMCAARQGKSKRGYNDAKYDAEKVVFYGGRVLADIVTPKGNKA